MNYLGLDIGTTSLSAVVVDDKLNVLHAESCAEDRFLPSWHEWERIQDVEKTIDLMTAIVRRLKEAFAPIAAIGITGQMHGMLYVNAEGMVVSPLYTWQDGRAGLTEAAGETYAQRLGKETGCKHAPGFGLATHRYNVLNGLVPEDAVSMTTIGGYLAMRLTGSKKPLLHVSDADSLGGFVTGEGRFAAEDALLPDVTAKSRFFGCTPEGIYVSVSIGDNQASFLGSAADPMNTVLLNVGTGGQVSAYAQNYVSELQLDCRPYLNGGYLLTGCPLCGGRAYAILESFLRSCGELCGVKADKLYEIMNRLAESEPTDAPTVIPTFMGTRTSPGDTGSILGLTENNFTPAHLISGLVDGMAEELHGYYRLMQPYISGRRQTLIGSGNGIARNPALQKRLSARFGMPMTLSSRKEEAAFGAVKFAMMCE